jgi:hypothetical protein
MKKSIEKTPNKDDQIDERKSAEKSSKLSSSPTHTQRGIPILYGQSSPGIAKHQRLPYSQNMEEIHSHLRQKYPKVADQIITLERDAPDEPERPVQPPILDASASEQDKSLSLLLGQIFVSEMVEYNKEIRKYKRDLQLYIEEEKACLAALWQCIGDDLKEAIKLTNPDINLGSDLIALAIAIKDNYVFSGHQTKSAKVSIAKTGYYGILQGHNESVHLFYKRFLEAHNTLDELGYGESKVEQARQFLRALDPKRFSGMMAEFINKESEYAILGTGEDPFPKNLEQAYKIAVSRVVGKSTSDTDLGQNVSSIFSQFRGADTFGKGGGERPKTKTNKKGGNSASVNAKTECEEVIEDDTPPPYPCTICGGLLNSETGDSDHWVKKCPLNKLSFEEKAKLYRNSKYGAKSPNLEKLSAELNKGKTKTVSVTFPTDEEDGFNYPFGYNPEG